jgi:hypothetical protein
MAGSIIGMAMLLFFRSIPLAAGTATAVIVSIIVIKHVALAMIVGSPLAALFPEPQAENPPTVPLREMTLYRSQVLAS